MVVIYRRFGTTYRSHFQGSSSPRSALALKLRPICCPESSVSSYQSRLRNIAQERSSLLLTQSICLSRCRWRRGLRRAPRPLASRDLRFESRREHGCLFAVSVVCCQVEVSASGLSLVQRSPTACGVSEYDREASIMRGSVAP
jgi:hypothetical protein